MINVTVLNIKYPVPCPPALRINTQKHLGTCPFSFP